MIRRGEKLSGLKPIDFARICGSGTINRLRYMKSHEKLPQYTYQPVGQTSAIVSMSKFTHISFRSVCVHVNRIHIYNIYIYILYTHTYIYIQTYTI